jgi:ParB family chromosome partitioning protein
MAEQESKLTGAQKFQKKFSGLVRDGVIPPLTTAEDKTYVSEVLEVNNALPPDEAVQKPLEREILGSASHREIPLDLIDDSPYQPRELYDDGDIDDLGHSMATGGQDEQITVRLMPTGRYELIKGHRRTRAARSLGWTHIEADIVAKSDRDAKLSAMLSNESRVDLTPYEQGKLYLEAKASGYAKTQGELAHLFGTSQERVSMRMAMLALPQKIVEMLEDNPRLLGADTAQDIRKLVKEYPDNEELIIQAVQRINEGANENSVYPWVKQALKPKTIDATAVVTDKAGRTIFKAKRNNREITIQIKDATVDAKEIEEMVIAALRAKAEEESL